jgi:DNA-binding MarR family transcriptional regulator
MSFVVSLSENGKVVCASNEYLANRFRVSNRTITRTISSLKQKGYIEIHITPSKRFIKLLNIPEQIEINDEVCDLETQYATHLTGETHRQIDETYRQIDEGVSSESQGGIDKMTSGYRQIDDHIVKKTIKNNNKEESSSVVADSYPPDFLSFVEDYGDPDPYFVKAYESWKGLTDLERTNALESIQAYTQSDLDGVGNRKAIHFYLHDKKWNQWRVKKHYKPKPKPVLTNQDIIRIFEKQNPDFLK